MSHHCHARGCSTSVRPELLMCYAHWRKVPPRLQQLVYSTYRPGQCDDKRPSRAWMIASDAAIAFIALLESNSCTKAEVRALIELGYETAVVAVWARRGPKYKAACERVIAELKKEMDETR